MRVLYYWRRKHSEGKRFQQTVESLITFCENEIYHRIEDLKECLRQPLCDEIITVFLIADQSDQSDILSIQHLLRNNPIVLILPDHKETTISDGHKMHPRFVSYIDSDFSDVAAVLNKMIYSAKNEKIKERRLINKFMNVFVKRL